MTFRSGYNDAWETAGWTAQNQAYPAPERNTLNLPADIELVTITGHLRAGNGGRANGWFDIDNGGTVLRHPSTKEFLTGIRVRVEIKDGSFSVTVPATDASTLTTESGDPWTYHIRVSLEGRPFEEMEGVVLPAAVPLVDIFDVSGEDVSSGSDEPIVFHDGGAP